MIPETHKHVLSEGAGGGGILPLKGRKVIYIHELEGESGQYLFAPDCRVPVCLQDLPANDADLKRHLEDLRWAGLQLVVGRNANTWTNTSLEAPRRLKVADATVWCR